MALGRLYAGPIVHKLSITKVLLFSAIFSCLGLFLLANTSGAMTFLAAAVLQLVFCYFWPTMLSLSLKNSESGALGLSLMGGAGMLSVSFVLPQMGKLMDSILQDPNCSYYMHIFLQY